MSEAEVAAIRAKEEEARIMAELPPLKVPFGRAQWEIDVSACVMPGRPELKRSSICIPSGWPTCRLL